MKHSRLRRIAIATLTLSLLSVLLSLTACDATLSSVKSMLSRKFEIELPSDAQLIYCHYESKDGWFGDGADYFVFKFNEEPASLVKNFKSLNLKEGDNPDELKEALKEYYNSIVGLIEEIPQEYLADWDSEIIWNYGSTLNGLPAIYYPQSMEMIVCILTV